MKGMAVSNYSAIESELKKPAKEEKTSTLTVNGPEGAVSDFRKACAKVGVKPTDFLLRVMAEYTTDVKNRFGSIEPETA